MEHWRLLKVLERDFVYHYYGRNIKTLFPYDQTLKQQSHLINLLTQEQGSITLHRGNTGVKTSVFVLHPKSIWKHLRITTKHWKSFTQLKRNGLNEVHILPLLFMDENSQHY